MLGHPRHTTCTLSSPVRCELVSEARGPVRDAVRSDRYRSESSQMDVPTAREHQNDDRHVLLDVREQPEWDAGHIEGAVHVPMTELNARQSEIPTDRAIICVCRSGQRSDMVTQALSGAGFDAHNLEGGVLAWVEAGHPLVTDTGAAGSVA